MSKASHRSVSAFSEGFTEHRPCKHCGSPFEPRTREQDFCPGGKCRKAYHNETYALGKAAREGKEHGSKGIHLANLATSSRLQALYKELQREQGTGRYLSTFELNQRTRLQNIATYIS